MVFIALTIPKFEKILQLVGAATVSTTSFMFPPIFYLSLLRQSHADSNRSQGRSERSLTVSSGVERRRISPVTWMLSAAITLFGLVGGVVSTYSALKNIFSSHAFDKPCYV